MEKFAELGLAETQPSPPIDIVERALLSARHEIEGLQKENETLRTKAEAFDTLARLTRQINYGGEAYVCSSRAFPWYIDDALYEIERAKQEESPDLDASDLAPVGDDRDQTDEVTLFKEAMGEFCNKVEAGQIKSRHTYVKFCRLLGRPINMDDIAPEDAPEGDMVRFDVALDKAQWPGQPAPATKA